MGQEIEVHIEDGQARPETVDEPTPAKAGATIADVNSKLDAIMAALGVTYAEDKDESDE